MRLNDNRMKYRNEGNKVQKKACRYYSKYVNFKMNLPSMVIMHALCAKHIDCIRPNGTSSLVILIKERSISLFISSFIFLPSSSICSFFAIDQIHIIHTRDAPTLAIDRFDIYAVHCALARKMRRIIIYLSTNQNAIRWNCKHSQRLNWLKILLLANEWTSASYREPISSANKEKNNKQAVVVLHWCTGVH